MGIEDLAKVSFKDQWLMVDREGTLRLFEKDSAITRWLKFLVQILCLGCTDPYGHIRIDRVAQAIYRHYRMDMRDEPKRHKYYVKLVENLLFAHEPIRTHRAALQTLLTTMKEEAPKPSVNRRLSF
jgi:hypothetical protein